MNGRLRQKGVTTVEFAIIGTAFMIVLFGVIEVGRAVFTLNTLGETTRRAARIATVCPINGRPPPNPRAAVLNSPSTTTYRACSQATAPCSPAPSP